MHEGQLDKGGMPYIEHPLRVAAALKHLGPEVEAAGVLHDVVEDTAATLRDLVIMFPRVTVLIVKALTRLEGETYEEFITQVIAAGPLAIQAKLKDIADNMRTDRPAVASDSLMKRYRKAKARLEAALEGE
jgi:(p)ppGpp synthase/HD superfamily hydrolase